MHEPELTGAADKTWSRPVTASGWVNRPLSPNPVRYMSVNRGSVECVDEAR
jgi:hypothetical protein